MIEDNHPIPKNVSGFQFKLIGEMTVKQFAYLAGSALLAYFFYILPFPWFFKLPFVVLFVITGILLAFVPYEGRPLDHWIINFLKAVFRPNQYVLKVDKTKPQINIPPTVLPSPPPLPSPSSSPLKIPETPPVKVDEVKEHPTSPFAKDGAQSVSKEELEKQLQELVFKKIEIEKGLSKFKRRLPSSAFRPTVRPAPATSQTLPIPKPVAPKVVIPNVPQTGNLISGAVKDSKGNILPNILVEVKDSSGNLVRAFKTNKLGAFMAATTLANGTYTIDFEDPEGKFKFESITITLDGKVVNPLEIKNLEPREELRRELFSQ